MGRRARQTAAGSLPSNSASSSSSSSFTSSPASPPGEAATRTPSPPPAPRAPDKVPLIFRYSSFPASVVANLRTANAPVAELWDETATQESPPVAGTNPASSLVLLGAAAVRTERLWLLAPTESGAEVGAVWHRGLHPVDGAFSARFEVVLDDLTRSLRSGFGFVMQRSAQLTRAIGAGAESHGYRGIDHSVTIAFDTNSRPRCPHPPGLHVSVFAQGRDPERGRVLRCGEVGGLLREGEAYPVVVKYSRRELEVFIGGASCLTCAVDIAEWVRHPAALVGFVAGGPSPGSAAALCLLQAWSFGGRGGGDAEAAPTEASPTPSDPPSAPAPPPPAPSPAPPLPPTSLSAASRPAPARAGADAAAEDPGAAPAGQPAGAPNVAQGPAGGPEAAALQAAREVLRRRLAGQQSSRRKPVLTSWPVLLTAGLVALVAVMYQSTLLPLTPA